MSSKIFSKIKNINREFFLHSIFFVSAIVIVIGPISPLLFIIYNKSHDNQVNQILYTVKTPYGTFEGLTPVNNAFVDGENGHVFIDSDGQEMRFYGSFSSTRETLE